MTRLVELRDQLRAHALAYPSAREDHPFGYTAFKVGVKPFALLAAEDDQLRFVVRLPVSGFEVLGMSFASPAPLGLAGKGWVQVTLTEDDDVEAALLFGFLEESFRAAAPKALAVQMTIGRSASRPEGTAPAPAVETTLEFD